MQGIAVIVRAFVVGNFLLGLLLASLSSVFLGDAPAVPPAGGAVSGFMSLIPYVGLPLAVIPPLSPRWGSTPSPCTLGCGGGGPCCTWSR